MVAPLALANFADAARSALAFGLHECVRWAMRSSEGKSRVLTESLIISAAILQQTIEIYFVLKSRFHYASDVVMAILLTHLLYTNVSIAVLANWWAMPGRKDIRSLQKRHSGDGIFQNEKTWLWNGLQSEGSVSLGCFCFGTSRRWIYSHDQISEVFRDIEKATEDLQTDNKFKMDSDTKHLLWDRMGLLRKRSYIPCPSIPVRLEDGGSWTMWPMNDVVPYGRLLSCEESDSEDETVDEYEIQTE